MKQDELRSKGGPPQSTVTKVESSVRPPDLSTLGSYLAAVGADLHDLSDALDEVRQGRRVRGRARSAWVAALVSRGVTPAVLAGIAIGTVGDDAAPADLVASAEAAAAELARAAVQEVRESSSRLGLVAEPTTNYGEGKKR